MVPRKIERFGKPEEGAVFEEREGGVKVFKVPAETVQADLNKDQERGRRVHLAIAEAKKVRDERKEIAAYMDAARGFLEAKFNVNNLTTSEGVELRKEVERQVARYNEQEKSRDRNVAGTGWEITNPSVEAAYLWLQNLYGITPETVKTFYNYYFWDGGEGLLYEFKSEEDRNRKHSEYLANIKEDRAVGCLRYNAPSSAFEEHLRKMRASAHTPEADV
ncbi:MAG: hypothetical protein AAB495_00125 [Patescibacteria group bacterium]